MEPPPPLPGLLLPPPVSLRPPLPLSNLFLAQPPSDSQAHIRPSHSLALNSPAASHLAESKSQWPWPCVLTHSLPHLTSLHCPCPFTCFTHHRSPLEMQVLSPLLCQGWHVPSWNAHPTSVRTCPLAQPLPKGLAAGPFPLPSLKSKVSPAALRSPSWLHCLHLECFSQVCHLLLKGAQ